MDNPPTEMTNKAGEENYLVNQIAKRARLMRRHGKTFREIGEKLGCSYSWAITLVKFGQPCYTRNRHNHDCNYSFRKGY